MTTKRTGVLLINLGTPEDPSIAKVRSYLKEFLMDPLVMDIPYPLRWLLVNGWILPRRPATSAAAYQKVWTDRGSPLLTHHLSLCEKVQKILGSNYTVEPGMRYGSPSIREGVHKLKDQAVDSIIAVPLYPQYSLAATESSLVEFKKAIRQFSLSLETKSLKAFYNHSDFLDAWTELASPFLKREFYDQILFSFHGVPERHVKKTDPTGSTCLQSDTCCIEINSTNKNCYRAQCFATARSLAEKLDLSSSKYTVCFQSRMGRTPWIRPFTDELMHSLPKQGIKNIGVLCPTFVADCLETLEEIDIRERANFLDAGGESFFRIPCLNSEDSWCQAVSKMVKGDLTSH